MNHHKIGGNKLLNTININLKTDIKTDRPTLLPITLMSQDKNNNKFILRFTNGGEQVILDDTYTVEVLTKFRKSGTSRLTTASVTPTPFKTSQDYATWEFDTAYITQDEKVVNYVYVRKAGSLVVSADANAFVFDVGLSEIDKDAGRVAEVYDENYQKYLDEFRDNVDFEEIAQAEQGRTQAETERELAEDERENAEEQRKIDHANRSDEFDGKADKVTINNLVENGDFSDGLNGWFYKNIDAEVVDGKVKATITDTDIAPTTSYFGQIGINLYKDHEYYLRFEMEPTKETLTNVYVNSNWAEFMRLPVNELSVYSGTVLSDSTKVTDSSNFRINHRPNMNYVIGDTYTIDNVMMIDLTETFGAGNEPTKEEMDELIKLTGYIDGEYALNNKEMLIWTLALIRRNKNAIITLGGY